MRAWWGVVPPPRDYDWSPKGEWRTKTTTTTYVPVDEDRIRKIVRKEIADIMPINVPDHPPEV